MGSWSYDATSDLVRTQSINLINWRTGGINKTLSRFWRLKIMLCEQVLGKLHDFDITGKTIEYVDIEWHEAFKKIHKKITDKGTEVGIRMDDSILARGLYQDDVIYADDEKLVVVNTPPCEVIRVSLTPGHEKMSAKVCYEIGNRHAPLFWGENDTFITIYNEPMLVMLQKIHGVQAEKEVLKLDFDRRISASIHNHHH